MNEPSLRTFQQWSLGHAVALLITAPIVFQVDSSRPIAIAALASMLYLLGLNWSYLRSTKPLGGPANWVTGLRLIGVLLLGGYAHWLSPHTIGFVALAIVLVDGLDGYLARRSKTTSTFGAYFDMETDALYVCMLSVVAYVRGYLPIAILFIGYLRYLNVVGLTLVGSGHKKEPRSIFGQFAAVFLMCTLAGVFLLTPIVYQVATLVASGLILYSFARSIYFQITH